MTGIHGTPDTNPAYPYRPETPKRVRVTGCADPGWWYADKIGQEFDVDRHKFGNQYVVILSASRHGMIDPEDCIVIDPPIQGEAVGEMPTTQAPDIFINVVEFTARPDGYGCRTPGDRSGKYITLADAEKLAAAPARLQAELDRALGTLESERQDLAVYRQLVGVRDGQIEALRSELAAYKKAKSENDERFMVERDEARARVDFLLDELAAIADQTTDVSIAQRARRAVEAPMTSDAALAAAPAPMRPEVSASLDKSIHDNAEVWQALAAVPAETSEPVKLRLKVGNAKVSLFGGLDTVIDDPAPSAPDAERLRERCEALETEWAAKVSEHPGSLVSRTLLVCIAQLRDALKGGEG